MIIDITNDYSGMFKRMNQQLVKGYQKQGIVPTLSEHRNNFEQTYKVKVIIERSRWAKIEFPTDQAYFMTALKWSS